MEELFLAIKKSLRISHNGLDDEIVNNIQICSLDMQRVGIQPFADEGKFKDKLVEKAVEFYCKWQFDFMGKGESFMKAYENLRDSLSLSGEYGEKS